MKKSLLFFLLLSNLFGFAQYTLIPDINFEKALIFLNHDSGIPDGKVLTANINSVESIIIDSESISDMTGIEDFINLKHLNITGNHQLTTLNLSKNTKLETLNCQQNNLQTLNIENNINLTSLACSENQLTALDLSNNTKLTFLQCESNRLQNLNIDNNIDLTYLMCGINQLRTLDISNNINFVTFGCYDNKLTTLDLTKNTKLETILCNNNIIQTLNFGNNNDLEFVQCYGNELTTLDFSNNTKLSILNCANNKLTTLNLKNIVNISFDSTSNPNLTCILVDDPAYYNTPRNILKDPISQFYTTCLGLPPTITAFGNQLYCPLTNMNIATNVEITDPDNLGATSVSVQISSGYVKGEDLLTLNNALSHPTIQSSWNTNEGKLTLNSLSGTPISYSDFEDAIRDVQFSNSTLTPNGIRNFSISIGTGQLNYLPRNGHYYEYVADLGITWTDARTAADTRTYYGLKGYLATITASDEAQLAGKQAPGAGWIGGSDSEEENTWKWMTGPEAGTIFWKGLYNGSTPNFAFWNTGEPNQAGDEDYAHITAPGVGIAGSWNDLANSGSPSGDYQPKGYIVEYGGTLGDPELHLSASTSLTIIETTTSPSSRCDAGTVTLQATATAGTLNWYDAASGGNFMGSGPNFTTPNLTTTTNFFVETTTSSCSSPRTAVEAKIINTPSIISTNSPVTNCGTGFFTLEATSSEGTINWYSQTDGSFAGSNSPFTTPSISSNTTYYAEAVNQGCVNSIKTPVDLIVYPLPTVSDETLSKCISQTITLDAGVQNMTYLWSTGATTQTIDVSQKGIYKVAVTSLAPEQCTSNKTITVQENNEPKIKNVLVDETTVTIELVQNENYFEFSIDGVNYQASNVFTNAPSGLQTAYVREINLCSSDQKPFIVIIVPKFFTPNNDGYNDTWDVKGILNYPLSEVTIFDRYGKLITQLNSYNHSWDGTFNKKPLPSTDYWYALKLEPNSPELKGHFSLKR